MTDEQAERLIIVLERIAARLQPDAMGRLQIVITHTGSPSQKEVVNSPPRFQFGSLGRVGVGVDGVEGEVGFCE